MDDLYRDDHDSVSTERRRVTDPIPKMAQAMKNARPPLLCGEKSPYPEYAETCHREKEGEGIMEGRRREGGGGCSQPASRDITFENKAIQRQGAYQSS